MERSRAQDPPGQGGWIDAVYEPRPPRKREDSADVSDTVAAIKREILGITT